ncbi:hypothetical protein ACH4TV_04625 [Streptomyces sp. NPDC020898]|uniref:hypothetical protein n=1 Tax=Streptomyces sp. NPDC020898 TaxID=3365101 RepID=UPI00378FE4D2
MTNPSAATVRRVTKDWAAAFPGFTVWRPLHLLRRIGPVVQGICLDRSTSGDGYCPTAHVHALTREFPVISLTLGHRLERLSGQPEAVLFTRQEGEFQRAVDALKAQSRLSLDVPPSLEEIVREYHSSSSARQEKGFPPAVMEMEDSILIAAAAHRRDLVEDSLSIATDLASKWPKARLPLTWVSADAWLEGMRNKADAAEALAETVTGQVAAHKLDKLKE